MVSRCLQSKMRFLLLFLALSWLLPAAAAPLAEAAAPGSPATGSKISIEVARGNWGNADRRDIQSILEATAGEFLSSFADVAAGDLNIRVLPRGGSPRVLYERGADGEHMVYLTARDDRWYQYAYQFSHELCHILSNFDHKDRQGETVASANQWFEESLCETASLFTLKRLAASWVKHPPKRNWIGYGPVFAAYADQLLAQPHRRLPLSQSFGNWYEENRSSLQASPYLREKNELVATTLLPLFEREPEMWQAIAYLNADRSSAAKPFAAYLADWHAACPPASRQLVADAMRLFGISPSGAPDRLVRVDSPTLSPQ